MDQIGLRLKTDISTEEDYPYIWSGTKYTIDNILEIANSPVPLYWNYTVSEYPTQYQPIERDCTGKEVEDIDDTEFPFTQETTMEEEIVDSDKVDCNEYQF